MSDEADLQAAVKAFGRVNFDVPCTIDGAPARIVMDDARVGVATASVVGQPPVASFADTTADHQPDSPEVRLVLAGTGFTATFADGAAAARLVRVLGVRQQVGRTRSGELDVPIRIVSPSYGGRRAPANDYEQWAEYTMFASAALFVVAGLSIAAGLVAAASAAQDGRGAAALLWVVVAAAGSVLPVCLGALARTVVLRFRLDDDRR